MYRIAVVEDEEQYRDEVCQYIQKYEEEHKLEFLVTTYADGQEIVVISLITATSRSPPTRSTTPFIQRPPEA